MNATLLPAPVSNVILSQENNRARPLQLPRSLLYSISARLGGYGLDLDSFEAVRGAWRGGVLGHAVVYDDRQSEVPGRFIRSLRWHPVRLLSSMSTASYYGAKKQYLDWITARMLARGDYDLVHSWSGNCVRTFREAKRRNIPTILEIPTWHRNKGKNKPALTKSEKERDALPLLKRWLACLPPTRQQILEEYELADWIVVLSQKAGETFLAAGVPAEKLVLIPRGTDVDRFKPGTPRPGFHAVYVGALIKRKGVDLLLRAWRRLGLKDATLTLVGHVHPEIEEALRTYGGPDIHVTGFVSNPEDYYRQANVHLFPSNCEGSAKTVYDAAACGLAQIVTKESGDVVEHGITGLLIPAGDEDALADSIEMLYRCPALCSAMGTKARQRMMADFTWRHYRERLLALYARAVNPSANRPSKG